MRSLEIQLSKTTSQHHTHTTQGKSYFKRVCFEGDCNKYTPQTDKRETAPLQYTTLKQAMADSPSPSRNSTQGASCGGNSNAGTGDFWIGVIASLLGSVILNLGLNIQKLAFVRNSKVPPEDRKPVYKNWLWMFGFVVFALGNAGDAVGLTFTAQSIITPIGAIALVSNLFFARLLIGEEIGCKTSIAIVSIILGVVSIVVSGNTNCSSVTLKTLKIKFVKPGFLIFAVIHMGTLICLLIYTCKKEKQMMVDMETDVTPSLSMESLVLGDSKAAPQTKVVPVVVGGKKVRRVNVGLLHFTTLEKNRLRIAYPLLASCFAAWTVLLSKSVGELVKESARSGESEFKHVETWLIFAGFLCSLPCQIMYINKGLVHFESMYIIPVFYSVWLIGSILMGALFWDEFAEFVLWQFIVFGLGVAFVMIGVVLLQQREIVLDDEEDVFDENAGTNNEKGSGGSKAHSSGGAGAIESVADVLQRRDTFFTRAAASVISTPQVIEQVNRSRNNSTASTSSNAGRKNASVHGVGVMEKGAEEVAVEMVVF